MSAHDHDHGPILAGLQAQLKPVLDASEQAIYVYLDGSHKFCNQRFAEMLGYASPEAWAGVEESFTEAFVQEASQAALVGAYQGAMQKKMGSQVAIRWKTKDGGEVATQVILVPVAYDGHLAALHFIEAG